MKEFVFTVIKTGYVNVEAESFEDAEAILQENLGHFYVSTDGQSCTGSFPIEKDWFGKDAITNLYRKAKTITDTHYNNDEELRLDKSLQYSTNLRSTWPWLK